ncbi:MAG: glutamate-5-semialdehyde dehydrogenase [Oscillospiraceae bacterium]|nr:glutamate-5-semialdehyde dehydrogenase [Oscillospiraceae bacterium]MCR4759192.1 glutamate-5-semialdehyde dehydrogenase [Oscillospiraceae bacterium]
MEQLTVRELGARAKAVAATLAAASPKQKNDALAAIADALIARTEEIVAANKTDLENAVKNQMSKSMQDRLLLNADRIKGIADGVRKLISLEEVVGRVEEGFVRPNGLHIQKTRVPLGVIGIIFESRPNVTVDAATLCMKAGNCVILRGGKEAFSSNVCLTEIMRDAVETAGLPADIIQLVQDTSRESSNQLMKLSEYLDVLIPRGGAGLINAVAQNATVPVIKTGVGNCHVYVDDSADLEMAVNIVDNGKTQRPSVCNAIETVLIHRAVAAEFLPMMKARLDGHSVTLHGDAATKAVLGDCVLDATDDDWATEYLDYQLAVKIVDDVDAAIAHIAKYGTNHSECIVTKSLDHAEKFQREVDAAAVYVNASTRFTDGGEFGFGAEIGISTQKLHARGPMGLAELTSVKYLINGNGQVR